MDIMTYYKVAQCSGSESRSRWIRVFPTIRILTLKIRFQIRPFFALVQDFNKQKESKWCSLIKFLEEPDQKDGVESAKYIVLRLFYLYLQFFGVFFVDPDPDCVHT